MKLQIAKGMRDFGPEEKILRKGVVKSLVEIFELYGYSPLETPIVERYDILSAKFGAGKESDVMKEIFKLTDQGKRKLGLRFDLTVPFARFIGMNSGIKMPFKRYQIGEVFRDGPIKLGRYREFWQCDVDVAGVENVRADSELICLAIDAFNKLGLDAYVELNNRKLLRGIIEDAGIKQSISDSVIISVDKLSKIGKSEVEKELKEKKIPVVQIKKLMKFFGFNGNNKEKIKFMKGKIKSKIGIEGLEEIEKILSYIPASKRKRVLFNLSLARGLGYYTGPIFECFLKNSKIKSSICAGGRYDEMMESYVGRKVPMTGISFGLDVIGEALKIMNQDRKKTIVELFVIPIAGVDCSDIVDDLRGGGIRTDLDLIGRGISKNLDYANKLGIPFVLFVGPKELKLNKFKLKDMTSGKEEIINLEKIIKKLV
jgi:histidyl-tRNA synthetase